MSSAGESLREFSESITSGLSTASSALKRELLELLVDRIEIFPEEIRIVYKVPTPLSREAPLAGAFHCWRRQRIAWDGAQ